MILGNTTYIIHQIISAIMNYYDLRFIKWFILAIIIILIIAVWLFIWLDNIIENIEKTKYQISNEKYSIVNYTMPIRG